MPGLRAGFRLSAHSVLRFWLIHVSRRRSLRLLELGEGVRTSGSGELNAASLVPIGPVRICHASLFFWMQNRAAKNHGFVLQRILRDVSKVTD
jgi:hypothetical protein